MTTVTISDVTSAVNKAFAAGVAGKAYEGLMPSAHDAGVHATASFGDVPDLKQAYLAVLEKAATIGFENGSSMGIPNTSIGQPLLDEAMLAMPPLLVQDVQNVYNEGYQAGKASVTGTDWTPWLIGGGIAAAALVVGAVVISRR